MRSPGSLSTYCFYGGRFEEASSEANEENLGRKNEEVPVG